MNAREPTTVGGLTVASLRDEGSNWQVIHAASGLPVFGAGFLRQRRFAVEARADFLATGIDWTLSVDQLRSQLGTGYRQAYALWNYRAQQNRIDWVTGEHYSSNTHYGQVIPSQAHARRLAAALACYVWS